jgi:hypothetical protein
MLIKLFKKIFTGKDIQTHEKSKNEPIITGMLRGIEEKKKTDPLIGAKIAGKEISQGLINTLKTEKGVHIESLLCALGSLAGYSCQANLRTMTSQNGKHENSAFDIVKTIDGQQYFFGDSLNQGLAESEHSVWSLSAAGAQEAGCKELPDILDIFKHVSNVVGSKDFGVLRVPNEHQPHHRPTEYLKAFWLHSLPTLKQFCQHPSEWPIAFSLEIQNIILMGKEVINPCISLKIVMESAIQMSKVDLTNI